MHTYRVPGKIKSPPSKRFTELDFIIMADDRDDARWKMNHGVIEARIAQMHSGTIVKYDRRKLYRSA